MLASEEKVKYVMMTSTFNSFHPTIQLQPVFLKCRFQWIKHSDRKCFENLKYQEIFDHQSSIFLPQNRQFDRQIWLNIQCVHQTHQPFWIPCGHLKWQYSGMCQLCEDAQRAICNFLKESAGVVLRDKWNNFVDIMFS